MAIVIARAITTARRFTHPLMASISVATLLTAGVVTPVATAATPQGHHRATVLGRKGLFGPDGQGWGTERPVRIYDGGGLVGSVNHLNWRNWDSAHAFGRGKTVGIKPKGGYYRKEVKAQLRAGDVGHCSKGGPRAYRVLWFRHQKRPGGSQWTHWRRWLGLRSICRLSYVKGTRSP